MRNTISHIILKFFESHRTFTELCWSQPPHKHPFMSGIKRRIAPLMTFIVRQTIVRTYIHNIPLTGRITSMPTICNIQIRQPHSMTKFMNDNADTFQQRRRIIIAIRRAAYFVCTSISVCFDSVSQIFIA